MNRTHWLLTIALFCVGLPPTNAQDAVTETEPTLETVFSDDFSEDSRSDYKTEGEVAWKPGQLTLDVGASVERDLIGSTWSAVDLNLAPTQLTEAKPTSEMRLWFVLDGATNCFVRFRREIKSEKVVTSVALVDTGEKDGKPLELLVREVTWEDDPRRVIVEYRSGLVRISRPEETPWLAHIENDDASVQAFKLTANSPCGLESLEARAAPEFVATDEPLDSPVLTASESEQLEAADAAHSQLLALYRQQKFAEAANYGEQVVKIRREVLGAQHPSYASALQNLGIMYRNLGDYEKTASIYEEVIRIKKSALGELHPDYANALNSLAYLRLDQGDLVGAKLAIEQSVSIFRRILGDQHPTYATTLSVLDRVCSEMDDVSRSERLSRQVLEIRRAVFGEQHLEYAIALNNLGASLANKGDYLTAESLYLQSLAIRKSLQGEEHSEYANALSNLSKLCMSMGDYTRAESYLNHSIAITKSVFGEQHPYYSESLADLGEIRRKQGDYVQAESLYRAAMAITKSTLGDKHPDYASRLGMLASVLREKGDFDQAEALFKMQLEILGETLGDKNSRFAVSLNNLALLYSGTGNYARAVPLLVTVHGSVQ